MVFSHRESGNKDHPQHRAPNDPEPKHHLALLAVEVERTINFVECEVDPVALQPFDYCGPGIVQFVLSNPCRVMSHPSNSPREGGMGNLFVCEDLRRSAL